MKIRHPLLIKAAGFAAAHVIRWWIGTLRLRYHPLGPSVDPRTPGFRDRYIYAFWHENMLFFAERFARNDAWVLISQHADGQLIAEACRHLRVRTIRGSTKRGGAEALREMVRVGHRGHLVITPDGPRGPRRHVQQGLVFLAAQTGLPIAPIGIGFERAWRARSWDRLALPCPWSLVTVVTDQPIRVPPDVSKSQIEAYRLRVEENLMRVTDLAERWAETGRQPRAQIRDPKPGIGEKLEKTA
jgi:lysophospholipid acyltransferase (LPLAT)-like uncharacterized protein